MRALTHQEACDHLNRAAKQLGLGNIDRDEWFFRVEKIIEARLTTAGAELHGIANRAATAARQTQAREPSTLSAPPGARA